MSRNQPMMTRSGAIIQSGLDPRFRDRIPLMKMMASAVYRAIVLNTFTTNDPENRSLVAVECDVFLIRANFQLSRVPVRQMNHGRNNAWAPWIPRPSTRVISTGAAVNFTTRSSRGTAQGDPSIPSDLDGDLVTVEFLEHDPDRPIITGALSQEQNLRRIIGGAEDTDASLGWKEGDYRQGSPRRNELFFSHYGSEIRVNGQGDALISTVGAFNDPTTEDASPAVGQMRIRVKNSQRFTVEMDGVDVLEVWKDGSQVRIDLGEGAAQHAVLGDDNKAAFDSFRSSLVTWIGLVATGISTGGGSLDNTIFTQAIADLGTGMQNALSDLVKLKKT